MRILVDADREYWRGVLVAGGFSAIPRWTLNPVTGVVERQDSTNLTQTVAVPIRYAIDLLNRLGVRWYALER